MGVKCNLQPMIGVIRPQRHHRRAEPHHWNIITATQKTPGIKLSSEPTFTVWCNHLFPLLTFTPVWNDRRKFLLVWIYFFLEQHVNGWEEGSITWLYIYPSEKNALFVLIWSSGDTDPYMKSFFSYQRWKTISVPEDGLLKIQQNRVNKDVVRLITGPMAKRMKK